MYMKQYYAIHFSWFLDYKNALGAGHKADQSGFSYACVAKPPVCDFCVSVYIHFIQCNIYLQTI